MNARSYDALRIKSRDRFTMAKSVHLKSLLEPGYFQSRQSEHTGHMVKHGSSYLRCALMNACLPFITDESVFAEYYAKKRAEDKPYSVALTHVAKKLLRGIYTQQTKNISNDPNMIPLIDFASFSDL